MNVKQQVLSLLIDCKGRYISGEEIAQKLSVSRNAVWKSIKSLQKEGHSISAVTNRGYCLSDQTDVVCREEIKKYLNEKLDFVDITVYSTIDSTNNELKRQAADGVQEGKVIVSTEQTGGKGRKGRAFFSPRGTGVYMSMMLKPRLSAAGSLYITTAAAVAVAKAVEAVSGKQAQIKWVNDIYIAGKKICGILTEAALDMESGGLQYAILGIGVNIVPPENGFPDEIKDIATAVFDRQNYKSDQKNQLIALIINNFFEYYFNISKKEFLDEYRKRSFVIGEDILVINGEKTERATAVEIDDEFRLVVRMADGSTRALSSGEVSIKRI